MIFTYKYIALAIVVLSTGIVANKQNEEIDSRIEPVSTAMLVSALAPVAINLISGLFGSLFSPADFQDTIIYGRSMRIKMCGDTCVQITDRASGITCVGSGSTQPEAIGEATQKMFHELLDKKLLSLHDLCYLNIHFPHPDTVNCAGVTMDTCSLIEITQVTSAPCVDKLGETYCVKNKNNCTNHNLLAFMMENCYKTCTNGCQVSTGPTNPCAIGRR